MSDPAVDPSSSSPSGWITLAILLVLSAVFSATELVLLAASRPRLRRYQEDERSDTLLGRLLAEPGQLLGALHAANTVVVAAAAVIAVMVLGLLSAPRGAVGAAVGTAAVMAMLGLAAGFVASRRVTRMLPRAEAGSIEAAEQEMIHSIFEFGDTVAREVMVPRIDMVCVADAATLDGVVRLIIEEGHSRIPVYHETIDQIVGVVNVKDILSHLKAGHFALPVTEVLRPAFFVPESKRLDELFREMQRKRKQMAIVVDEYGGTAGLVTIEDLLEEIVGPIHDEYDVEEKLFEAVGNGSALVDGRMSIEEVNELMGLDLPVGDVDTIGGYVYSLLGHVPTQGEPVTAGDVEIVVDALEGHRIARVRISRRVPAEPLRP